MNISFLNNYCRRALYGESTWRLTTENVRATMPVQHQLKRTGRPRQPNIDKSSDHFTSNIIEFGTSKGLSYHFEYASIDPALKDSLKILEVTVFRGIALYYVVTCCFAYTNRVLNSTPTHRPSHISRYGDISITKCYPLGDFWKTSIFILAIILSLESSADQRNDQIQF